MITYINMMIDTYYVFDTPGVAASTFKWDAIFFILPTSPCTANEYRQTADELHLFCVISVGKNI